MEHEIKVSVAIPVYNAGKHLKECLDSVVNQTMGSENIEIICVNDKPKDNSLNILKEYKEAYSNIKVIDREFNSGGASAPRNDAIEAASGIYILFLDSDDYLGEESIERLYNYAKEHDSDVIFGKYKGVNGRGVPKSMFKGNIPDADIIKNNLIYAISPQKMFRTSILRENNILFMTDAKTAEDQVFVMEFYSICDKISVLSDYDYYYLTNREEGHLSGSFVPPNEYFKVIGRVIDVINNGNFENEVYKYKVIGTYLNRFFKFGRNSKFFESKSLSQQEKLDWMFYFNKFLNDKVDKSIDSYVNSEFKDRLKYIRDNDLLKLQLVEEFKKKINANNVIDIVNGNIIAKLQISNKNFEVNEQVIVNNSNKSQCVLNDVYFSDGVLNIRGQFYNSLLYKFKTDYSLLLVNRKTKKRIEIKEELVTAVIAKSEFLFNLFLKDLVFDKNDAGIWDISVVSNTKGRVITKRIGSERIHNPEILNNIFNFESGVTKFSVKLYMTANENNLSLDVKVIQDKEEENTLKKQVSRLKRKTSPFVIKTKNMLNTK